MDHRTSTFFLVMISPAVATAASNRGATTGDRLASYLNEPAPMALAMIASAIVVGAIWIVLARAQRPS